MIKIRGWREEEEEEKGNEEIHGPFKLCRRYHAQISAPMRDTHSPTVFRADE